MAFIWAAKIISKNLGHFLKILFHHDLQYIFLMDLSYVEKVGLVVPIWFKFGQISCKWCSNDSKFFE